MTTVAFLIFCFVLTLLAVTLVADGRNRVHLWEIVTMAWMVGLSLVVFVNDIFPFAGGGDDSNYYNLATASVDSLTEAFDLTRFVGSMEQPGYPWLLSLVNHFAGSELLTFKAMNLTLYILLAVVWYRIGTLLQGSAFGRKAMLVLLLLTPLWFYFMFLLKDMAISLLQSLFLLGLVEQSRRNTFRAWLLIFIPIFALFLFRTPLVLQSSAVLLASLLVASLSRGGKGVILAQLIGWIIVAGLLAIGSDQDVMASMGIHTEHRLLGSSEMMEAVSDSSEASLINRTLFPLLYLFSETSGLNPQTWVLLDQYWLRGLLALPWLFIVPPIFILGVIWLTKSQSVNINQRRRFLYSRMVATPWAALVIFVISYIALSWNIGDTTRWRIPDMPAIAVIALAGWHYTHPRIRWQVLKLWISGVGILFSLNILLKS